MELAELIGEFGLGGFAVVAFFVLLRGMMKDQRDERESWITAYREHSEVADQRQKETNEILREHGQMARTLQSETNQVIRELTRAQNQANDRYRHYDKERRDQS